MLAGDNLVPYQLQTFRKPQSAFVRHLPKVFAFANSGLGRTLIEAGATKAFDYFSRKPSSYFPKSYGWGAPKVGFSTVTGNVPRKRRRYPYRKRYVPPFLWDKYHRKGALNFQSSSYGNGRRTIGRGGRYFNRKGRTRRFKRTRP